MRNRFQKAFLMATLLLCSSYGGSQESKLVRKTVMAGKNTIKESDFGKKYDFFDIVKDIEFVPLEMTDESIVGSVSKIKFYNTFMLVLDGQTKSIFIFDDKGKYIRKISRVGKGPGEYNDIDDFCVHPTTGMITIVTSFGKIITYSFDLKEFKEYNDVPYAVGIEQFNNGYYAITSIEKEANLYILDANMKIVHKGLANPFPMPIILNKSFSKYGDTILCRLPTHYNDTIYQITPNSFRPWRVPDFEVHPDYSNPTKYLEPNPRGGRSYNCQDMQISGAYSYSETNKFISFAMTYSKNSYGMRNLSYVIYSKKNKTVKIFSISTLQNAPFDRPITYIGVPDSKGRIVSAMDANFILDCKITKDDPITSRLKELKKQLNEESNPVIAFITYKE